jgi:hypothetical protein
VTDPTARPSTAGRPSFAHASEAELARILDFYEVRWSYEPDTFPIGWNLEGDVVESFAPDFYLPDLDLYIELTTLKQKLVRKKNRKLRRLRELYPDVRIKLFYARDFRMLMLKFGRMALIDELTGTTGQATPPRPQVEGETGLVVADLLPLPAATGPAASAGEGDPAAEAAQPGVAAPGAGPGPALLPAGVPATGDDVGRDRRDVPPAGAGAPGGNDPGTGEAAPSGSRGRRRGRRRHKPSVAAVEPGTIPSGLPAEGG